jgi:hypothetical protein
MMKDLSRYANYSKDDIEYVIDQWIICRRNAERDRAILKRVLFDGISYERVAEEYGLTPRQISNIIYETEEILFKHL